MANIMYEAALLTVFTAIALALVSDRCLAASGQPTITDFLRANHAWFWWPAGLLLTFVLGLAIHLYGPWAGGGQ